jgi:hypothetical protein
MKYEIFKKMGKADRKEWRYCWGKQSTKSLVVWCSVLVMWIVWLVGIITHPDIVMGLLGSLILFIETLFAGAEIYVIFKQRKWLVAHGYRKKLYGQEEFR